MDTFGEILVKIRKSCGLTQSELAKKNDGAWFFYIIKYGQ